MKHHTGIWLIILLLLLQGCTSYGRLMFLEFDRTDSTYHQLENHLSQFKWDVYDSSTAEEYKALKALKHLIEYNENIGKQLLAIEGLTFLAAYADDDDVKEKADNKLSALLLSDETDLLLKTTIVRQKSLMILPEIPQKANISDKQDEKPQFSILPEADARIAALDFILSAFEESPVQEQHLILPYITDVLNTVRSCKKIKCSEDETELIDEMQSEVWEAFENWLENNETTMPVKVNIIVDVLKHHQNKAIKSADTKFQKWLSENNLPDNTNQYLKAALNRLEKKYPEMVFSNDRQLTTEQKPAEKYQDQKAFTTGAKWLNYADFIFQQQLFVDSSNDKTNKEKVVPLYWLGSKSRNMFQVFNAQTSDQTLQEIQEVLFPLIGTYLEKGAYFKPARLVAPGLFVLLKRSDRKKLREKDHLLNILSRSYSTIKQKQNNIQQLLKYFKEEIQTQNSAYLKYRYMQTMTSGILTFPRQIQPLACRLISELDMVSQQRINLFTQKILISDNNNIFEYPSKIDSGSDSPFVCQLRTTTN